MCAFVPTEQGPPDQLHTRRLLRREITYSSARAKEVNILHQLEYRHQEQEFFSFIEGQLEWITQAVGHHLSQAPGNITVAGKDDWLHGSFNVCIPVSTHTGVRALFRVPLPYRVGESFRPGNADEKIRCEAGTYAWIEQNCPDVPIPRLYGFATSTGIAFTRLDHVPFLSRCVWRLFRGLRRLVGLGPLTPFVRTNNKRASSQDMPGYLLIEHIDASTGEMLSNTWTAKKDQVELRTNLFRSLSRIFLSLARLPLRRIGSFVIEDQGVLSLTNRPLSIGLQGLENEGIPVDIAREDVYSSTDSFVLDSLAYHDNCLQYQPNAINDVSDFIYQASTLAAMRAVFPMFFRRELRHGPFFFTLTDLHQSNIFVDEHWNITALVDLEWGCSLPAEMIHPPHWFVDKAVDCIDADEFDSVRREFMDVLVAEEGKSPTDGLKISELMSKAWDMGTFWYSLALTSPTGLFSLFDKMIWPSVTKRCPEHGSFYEIMTWFWKRDRDTIEILKRKLSDRKEYDIHLEQAFQEDWILLVSGDPCPKSELPGPLRFIAPLDPMSEEGKFPETYAKLGALSRAIIS